MKGQTIYHPKQLEDDPRDSELEQQWRSEKRERGHGDNERAEIDISTGKRLRSSMYATKRPGISLSTRRTEHKEGSHGQPFKDACYHVISEAVDDSKKNTSLPAQLRYNDGYNMY
jgi:hypothetical protein